MTTPTTAAGASAAEQYGLFNALHQGGVISWTVFILLVGSLFISLFILLSKWWEQQKIISQAKKVRASFWSAPNLRDAATKLEKNTAYRQIVDDGLLAEDQHDKLKDPIDQQRILGQVKTVEKKFWTSATLNEGIDKLPKSSMFRGIAEAGVNASTGGTSLVGMNDWIGMSLTRQLEDANGKLQGGVTFLASVGSVSPFVGLFGTVMGILNALIGIGVAGQASIDKVAGPVGEALIMTALGLAVAVPAVLLYNYLVRRNKVIVEKLRSFAGDLQTYLVSKK